MADKKITELTANTAPAESDVGVHVDDPSGTPVTKKATLIDLARVGRDYGILYTRGTPSAISLTAANWTLYNQWNTDGEDRGVITADQANNRITVASTSAVVAVWYQIYFGFLETSDTRTLHNARFCVNGTPVITNGDVGVYSDASTVSGVYDFAYLAGVHVIPISSNPTHLTVEIASVTQDTTFQPLVQSSMLAVRL